MIDIRFTVIFFLILLFCHVSCKNGTGGNNDVGLLCTVSNNFNTQTTHPIQNLDEPSGVVYHPQRNTMFIVGDEGDIAEVDLQGSTIRSRRIDNLDLEGITVDPNTGLLYACIEASSQIIQVNPENLEEVRSFNLNWILNGREVLLRANEHIESITFVPDSTHNQGGTFYIVNRSNQIASEKNPSSLYRFELPLNSPTTQLEGSLMQVWPLRISGVSGLYYDGMNNIFHAVSDDRDAVFKLSLDGKIQGCYQIPGTQQEGIAITADGSIYVVDDREGVAYIFRE